MLYSRLDFKVVFLDKLLSQFAGKPVNILDLGCGTSKDFSEILKAHPNVRYFGMEQNAALLQKAKHNLSSNKNITLLSGFGESIASEYDGFFDLTLSLSVLEHVKHLKSFLDRSVRVSKEGGLIVHRYDLGHAYHSRLPERAKVWICNNLPWLIPASRFTFKPDREEIEKMLTAAGAKVIAIEYAQMPSLKFAMNKIEWGTEEGNVHAPAILDLDSSLAKYFSSRLSARELEIAFPAITISARKMQH